MVLTISSVTDATQKLSTLSNSYNNELANLNTINARISDATGFTGPIMQSTYNPFALFGATAWSGENGQTTCIDYCTSKGAACVGTVYAYAGINNVYPNSCSLIGGETGANTPTGYLPNGGVTGSSDASSVVRIQNLQYQKDLANYSNQLLKGYSRDINTCLSYIKGGSTGSSSDMYDSLIKKYSALLEHQREIEDVSSDYANSKIEITREFSNYMVYAILAGVILACIINLYLFPDNNFILIAIVIISVAYISLQIFYFNIPVFKLPNVDWSYYNRSLLNYYN
jgi:hypothetical protein